MRAGAQHQQVSTLSFAPGAQLQQQRGGGKPGVPHGAHAEGAHADFTFGGAGAGGGGGVAALWDVAPPGPPPVVVAGVLGSYLAPGPAGGTEQRL